ncbi:MAG: ABC transporter ATP-binding protein [Thermosphaera sp.]
MNAINVTNLKKKYRVREGLRKVKYIEAVRDVTFHVRKGEIHALLGPNGAGKTTIIKIISTLLYPDDGVVEVMGLNVVEKPEEVRRVIGLAIDVSKGFYSSLSGFENLVFYGLMKGLSMSEAKRRAKEALSIVELDEMGASDSPYFTYSLGMRARLAIAKALLTDPDVLLLDEPTLGLDVESSKRVRELLVNLSRKGKTILVTGHNMHEIELISNTITIINQGRVVSTGTSDELKTKVGLLYRLILRVPASDARFLRDYFSSIMPVKVSSSATDVNGISELNMLISAEREEIVEALFKSSKEMGVKILDFQLIEPSLEDAYLAILGASNER